MTVIYILAVYKVYIYICLYVVGTGFYKVHVIYTLCINMYISLSGFYRVSRQCLRIYKYILYNKIMIFKIKL